MRRLWWLVIGCLLLVACGSEEGVVEEADVTGFEFVGMVGFPAGFDAQGHRGARGLVPENTPPSFEAALDLGVTTLELDLHFTEDGQVVVWHDPIIEKEKCRLPEEAGEDVPNPRNPLRRIFISQQSLATVQMYVCDLNPDESRFAEQAAVTTALAGSDYGIVTLGELFDFVAWYAESEEKTAEQRANAETVGFNIETKRRADSPENIGDGFTGGEIGLFELAILAEVEARGLRDRVVIQSFDSRSLRTIREVDETIRLAMLTTGGETKVQVYAGYGFDVWSPNAGDVTADLVAEAHGLGLLVIPWTVNEAAEMVRLVGLGVDGLISDRPDVLLGVME